MSSREFGISEYSTPMWGFEEDLTHFRAAGAACVELCEAKLKPEILDRQLAALKESGLRVSSFQPTVPAFFDVKLSPSRGALEGNRRSLFNSVSMAGQYKLGDRLNTITGVIPRVTWAEAIPTLAGEYRELCKRAKEFGIKIMIEPLTPMYCGLDSMISTLDQAAELIDAVGEENFGITLDVYHVWQQAEVYDQIKKYASRIWAVHINDWKPVRCASDRHVPGEGEIPLGKFFHALEQAGYNNGYVVEFFSDWLLPDSLWRQPMDDVLRRCKAGFDKAWETPQ
jgi:sugar phosphate isomerase/epimerase